MNVIRKGTAILAGLVMLSAGTAGALAEDQPPNWVEWDCKTDRVVSHTDKAAAYPRAKRVSNGDVLLAYHHGGGLGEYGTWVTMRRSRDGGATWYATADLEGPEDGRFWGFSNVDFVELGAGRMLLVTAARGRAESGRPEFLAECQRSGLRVRFSDDFGDSWGEPALIARGRGRLWEPCLVRLPDGELQIYFANEAPDLSKEGRRDQRIELIRSNDDGATWSEPVEVSQHPKCRNGMPSAVVLPGGRVACAQEMVGAPLSPWITQIDRNGDLAASQFEAANEESRVGKPSPRPIRVDEYVAQRTLGFGAAPFLLKAPDGSTLMSLHCGFQKPDAPADATLPWMFSNVWVQRGTPMARNFGASSNPWPNLNAHTGAFFASLFLKDKDTLVALASFITLDADSRSRTNVRWIEGRLK
ncbi:MAG: sialidase family protein [Verrucomicrobiales bacterium]